MTSFTLWAKESVLPRRQLPVGPDHRASNDGGLCVGIAWLPCWCDWAWRRAEGGCAGRVAAGAGEKEIKQTHTHRWTSTTSCLQSFAFFERHHEPERRQVGDGATTRARRYLPPNREKPTPLQSKSNEVEPFYSMPTVSYIFYFEMHLQQG